MRLIKQKKLARWIHQLQRVGIFLPPTPSDFLVVVRFDDADTRSATAAANRRRIGVQDLGSKRLRDDLSRCGEIRSDDPTSSIHGMAGTASGLAEEESLACRRIAGDRLVDGGGTVQSLDVADQLPDLVVA